MHIHELNQLSKDNINSVGLNQNSKRTYIFMLSAHTHVECAKCVDVLNYKNINIYKLYGLTQLFGNTIGSSIDVVQ